MTIEQVKAKKPSRGEVLPEIEVLLQVGHIEFPDCDVTTTLRVDDQDVSLGLLSFGASLQEFPTDNLLALAANLRKGNRKVILNGVGSEGHGKWRWDVIWQVEDRACDCLRYCLRRYGFQPPQNNRNLRTSATISSNGRAK